jgi:hypothetical protein
MTETLLFQETRGGARKNAGRKSPKSVARTAEADRLNAIGTSLLEICTNYVRQWAERGEYEKAFAGAVPLLPYLHPRLAAVAVQQTKTELTLAELIEQSFKPQIENPKTDLKTITVLESIDDLL